jgi:hypothetical protein
MSYVRSGGILCIAALLTLWYFYEVEPRDHYDALGVSRTADIRTLKKAYRAKGLKYHPDKTRHSGYDTTKKFARISGSFDNVFVLACCPANSSCICVVHVTRGVHGLDE